MNTVKYLVLSVRHGELVVSEGPSKKMAHQIFNSLSDWNLAFPLYILDEDLKVERVAENNVLGVDMPSRPKSTIFKSIREVAEIHDVKYINPKDRYIVIQISNGRFEIIRRGTFEEAKKEFMLDFDMGEAFPLYILNDELQVVHKLPVDVHDNIEVKPIGWAFSSIDDIRKYHNAQK